MNFQQLRYVRETVRQGLNLTEAAKKLFTSQPGVSKQIRELENELGVEIFVRHGKRIVAVTEPGKAVVEVLAQYAIVTYDAAFAGRGHIDEAFRAQGLAPNVVLSAVDSDVIKTYVELGLGIGIIAAMAFDGKRDRHLRALEAGHLFGTMTTRVAVRRGAALRGYAYTFIELFSPRLSRKLIDTALAGKAETYEL